MTCVGCGAWSEDRVVKTADQGRLTKRRIECGSCGGRWTTTEKPDKDSFVPSAGNRQTPPLTDTGNGQTNGFDGQDGSNLTNVCSDPISSGSFSSVPKSRSGSGARALPLPRGPNLTYPSEFEGIWSECASGHKFPAFNAWKKAGVPAAVKVIAAWKVYLTSDGPSRGFCQHLSTWINARGHEEAAGPGRPAIAPPGANGSARNGNPAPSPYCEFHRGAGSGGKVSFRPTAICPECKTVTARNRVRNGEPTGVEALMKDVLERIPT